MSESIALVATTVVPMPAGRRQHREPSRPGTGNDEPDGKDAAPTEVQAATAGPAGASAPQQSTATLLAETLFAATVLGQRVRMLETQLNALRLAQGGQWSPPESALRLTDKTI